MRRLVACLACTLSVGLAAATAPVGDSWSGHYGLQWLSASQAGSRVVLAKAPDADPGKLVEEYQSDLVRWTIADLRTPTEDGPMQESLLASTGVFGIVLHAGAFELKKE
ncbi:MAG: hypothetical protein JF626_01675 [Polaromonas sp.]|nr:hypothetical protein [Polaromonas sp.]